MVGMEWFIRCGGGLAFSLGFATACTGESGAGREQTSRESSPLVIPVTLVLPLGLNPIDVSIAASDSVQLDDRVTLQLGPSAQHLGLISNMGGSGANIGV